MWYDGCAAAERTRYWNDRMSKLTVRLALDRYDRHMPFFDGTVHGSGDLAVEVYQVGQGPPLRDGTDRHERMIVNREFDGAEFSLGSYVTAKAEGLPIVAIPVFPRRLFTAGLVFVRTDSEIRHPRDLAGRRVGIRSAQQTFTIQARGDLDAMYDVPWRYLRWAVLQEDLVPHAGRGATEAELLPSDKGLGTLLTEGTIDAMIYSRPPREYFERPKRIRRLFETARAEERAYYRRFGCWPIVHVVALRSDLCDHEPWIVPELISLFARARALAQCYYDDPNWSRLAWAPVYREEEEATFAQDPWVDGLEANRSNLERFVSYARDQGLIDRDLAVDDLFIDAAADA